MSSVQFPIYTADGAQALINGGPALIALIEMRDLCENQLQKKDGTSYWDLQEYLRWKYMGTEVRFGIQSAISLATQFFPEVMKQLTKLGLVG